MKTIYLKLFFLAILFSAYNSASAQTRVVKIDGIVPGQPLAYDQIYNAINSDAPNRASNKNVIYELRRGQVYLSRSTTPSTDFNLHLRAEAGTGPLPLVFQTLNTAGKSVTIFNPLKNLTLENIEFDMKHSDGTLGARVLTMSGVNGRVILRGCWITNDLGSAFAILVDGVKFYMNDCIIGNQGHQISVGGNGRALDIRNKGILDTVVIQNSTIYNLTDRIIRNMTATINFVKFDHNTVYNIQGYHGGIQLGKAKKTQITNNIFANPLTYGDRLTARWRSEQLQPDKGICVITHDSLSSKLTSATVEMRNNNIYFEKKFLDYFNQTPLKDSIVTPRNVNNAIVKFVGSGMPQAYFSEELTFKNVSSSQALYNFTTYYYSHPKAAVLPNNFSEIYPYEWNVTYSETSKSYKAADGGYPLGNLNAWPTLKAQWAQNVVQKSASIKSMRIDGVEIAQIYPNPFTDQSTITYSITEAQKVEVCIYNSLGQKIKTIVNAEQQIGDYNIRWNGTNDAGDNLPKGLYLLNLSGTNGKVVQKIIKN